jgi:hypothetical protein
MSNYWDFPIGSLVEVTCIDNFDRTQRIEIGDKAVVCDYEYQRVGCKMVTGNYTYAKITWPFKVEQLVLVNDNGPFDIRRDIC